MDIVLDIGTSLSKIALFKNEEIFKKDIVKNGEWIHYLFEDEILDNAIISSVSEDPTRILDRLNIRGHKLLMSHELNLPVTMQYQTPETLGMDRLAAVIGAQKLYPNQNILVIDAGTCITFDILDEKGVYHGGAISPGIDLKFRALHNYTAHLPLMARVMEVELVGNTTKSAILSGVINGTIAEINEIIRMYGNKFPHLQLVICGGDADYYSEHLSEEIQLYPDLVLIGLKTVLDYNV